MSELEARDSVDARAAALYGAPLAPAVGVVHVVAVAREGGRALRVMKIGPAPKSETDLFVLSLTRARVDAIVVSGSVLRAEPELRYDLSVELAAWRGAAPPRLLVLTRGADLPTEHPVWRSEARPLVYTGARAAPALRGALPGRVDVVGVDAPSARGAIAYLREELGCRSVSIEAGPRVAVPLYEPLLVDELLLSVYEGELDAAARGGAFLSEPAIAARLTRVGGPTEVEEPSGRWAFSRWISPCRRGTAAGSR